MHKRGLTGPPPVPDQDNFAIIKLYLLAVLNIVLFPMYLDSSRLIHIQDKENRAVF
jgi:hypothetical protein